jgi:hypothetical protein
MKKINITIFTIVLMSSGVVQAAIYNIGPGDDFGNLGVVDYDEFFMTGGQGHNLDLLDWSIATIENTNPIIGEGEGGIWEIEIKSFSELTVSGGEINDLFGYDYSEISLSGGQILGDLTVYNDTSWVHIFGYGFNNDPFMGSPLTGYWANDIPFSINLVDSTISTYDQIVFHIIPEPATLFLVGLGGIMLRKRAKK